ncbi:hypothetical protein LDL36_18495 [Komagataeibacter sp. FNDCR1]|nr:hypothetical protein [Komagataeibacter sp. FNDCR1]
MIDFKARLACDITPADPEVARRSIAQLRERGLWPLPEDYLEFLTKVSRLVSEEFLAIRSSGDYGYCDEYVGFEIFFTARGGGNNDIVCENETSDVKGMINIGDAYGHPFLMSLEEKDFGHIYYLVKEFVFFDEQTGEEFEYGSSKASVAARRHQVATSFTELLNLMRCNDVDMPRVNDPWVYGDQLAWASQDGVRPRHPGWDDD